MKLGLGLYRRMLTPDNFRFARQAGATHIVAHLLNYFSDSDSPRFRPASSQGYGFGISDNRGRLWTYEELRALRIYRRNGFEGIMVPDHTPQLTCPAPWHAGMAYALGWMRAALTVIEHE